MPSLPVLSGREVIKAFQKAGWHIILVKPGKIASLSVPDYREVAKGTLRSLIRASELTVEEFIKLTH